MGYKKEPVGHMKASTGNKAVGFMTEGSSAYMSALHQTDPKDGVVVTGDASKIGGQTTMTEREKNKADYDKKIEAKRIELANKKMQQELERETRRAEVGARLEQRRQKRREQEGKDYIDPKTGNVVRRSGPLNQNDPKDGGKRKLSPGADVDGFGNPVIQNDYLTERNTRFAAPGPAAQPNKGRVKNTLYPTSGTPKRTASGETAVREYTYPSTDSLNASGYTQYGNNSTRNTFNDAFKQARESGAKTFQYGKKDYKGGKIQTYSTKLKS